MVVLIGIATVLSTLLGGLFALKFKDKLHLILGFSAGAVIAVAFFDLLPEAITLGSERYPISTLTSLAAAAFLAFMILDRAMMLHGRHSYEGDKVVGDPHRGDAAATTLSVHSFLDGLAIGFAFKVSPAIGAIVAAAVLTHDFSDGINTINLVLKNHGTPKGAFRWLILDAIAPALGIIATLFFSVSEPVLGLILATFSGFFLYIGASDLLPESHHRHPRWVTTIMTLLGAGVLFAAVRLAQL